MTIECVVILVLCVLRMGANMNSTDDPATVGMSVCADLIIASFAIGGLVRG